MTSGDKIRFFFEDGAKDKEGKICIQVKSKFEEKGECELV
jgi:hypothetical protein